jgi:hypothetical protein
MCRLFGLTAGYSLVRATFWLLDAPDSLEEQSHRNPDGCGVAGFDSLDRIELHKAPVAAWDDPVFGNMARDLTSSTFVAHVRHATTGDRRYKRTLIPSSKATWPSPTTALWAAWMSSKATAVTTDGSCVATPTRSGYSRSSSKKLPPVTAK